MVFRMVFCLLVEIFIRERFKKKLFYLKFVEFYQSILGINFNFYVFVL